MSRTPPPSGPRPPNPVARGDAMRRRKAGPITPKSGKGAPYDRKREPPVDPDPQD